MPRTSPSPFASTTSSIVRSLKKTSWPFKCSAGDFEDNYSRISSSKPFISLPLDPFATYTIPSRNGRHGRCSAKTPSPFEFPSPPPRSPTTFRHKALPSPPPATTQEKRLSIRREFMGGETRQNQEQFKSKMVEAKLAAISLACTGYVDDMEEEVNKEEESRKELKVIEDDESDAGSIFTLFGDKEDWEQFEEALFFLRPSKSSPSMTASSTNTTLQSSFASSSSLACSAASSASSVYSTDASPEGPCIALPRSH